MLLPGCEEWISQEMLDRYSSSLWGTEVEALDQTGRKNSLIMLEARRYIRREPMETKRWAKYEVVVPLELP